MFTNAHPAVVAHPKARHPELAKDLQLIVCSTASACLEPGSASLRTRGGEKRIDGGSLHAQNDEHLWLAVAWIGCRLSPLISARWYYSTC